MNTVPWVLQEYSQMPKDQRQPRWNQMVAALENKHEHALEREVRIGAAMGHILALPFSDNIDENVRQAVLNTGIHSVDDDNVKFAMAAHVECTGVAFVCCIWIYVAAVRGQ